tara:strand:+ start:6604 stop:6876 length:273 start_codon:yes stop_codon:yes gene_type:complete
MKREYFHVIGRPNCPYCDNAVRLLKERGRDIESETFDRNSQQLNEAKKNYNWKTVPIINHVQVDEAGYIHERFVGGFTDLVEYLRGEADG